MRIRLLYVLAAVLVVGTAGLGESGGKKWPPEETAALENRVGQLEDEIAELKRMIVELREHLVRSSHQSSDLEASPGPPVPQSSAPFADRAATEAPTAQAAADPNAMRLYWSDGIRMETADRRVRLSAGGRIMNDWNFHYGDTPGFALDGAEFRRSRVYILGEIGRVDFKAEYDFAGIAGPSFTDVYVGIRDIPVLGNLKIGRFKEPFGLEQLTSSRHITLMERSLTTTALAPSRNFGFMFSNTAADERFHWAAGFFKDALLTNIATGDGSYVFTGRVAGTPWKESGTRLLHLGAAYSHRDQAFETARFRTRPEAHLASPLVNTGFFPADSNDRVGLEAALVYDRFSVQTEVVNTSVDSIQGGNPSFNSFYVQGSLFLTNDARRYSGSLAAFDRVSPSRSLFNGEGGAGAWELALRYSQIDLDDGFVLGGQQKNINLGLNWYLNPNSRFMFGFVHADPENSSSLKILQTRFQIDF